MSKLSATELKKRIDAALSPEQEKTIAETFQGQSYDEITRIVEYSLANKKATPDQALRMMALPAVKEAHLRQELRRCFRTVENGSLKVPVVDPENVSQTVERFRENYGRDLGVDVSDLVADIWSELNDELNPGADGSEQE